MLSGNFCSSLVAETILPYCFKPDVSKEAASEEVYLTIDVTSPEAVIFKPDVSKEAASEEVYLTIDIASPEAVIVSHRIGNTDSYCPLKRQ